MKEINIHLPPAFEEGEEQALINYLDAFIVLCPSHTEFTINEINAHIKAERLQTHKRILKFELQQALQNLNLVQVQGTAIPVMNLTEKGKEVKEAGGWTSYKKIQKKKEKRNALKWWIPHIIAIIAVFISLYALFKPDLDKEKLKQEIIKELKANPV